MSDLTDFLKKLRGKLSLREAAVRSGLSHSYIGYLEAGKHPTTGVPINPSPESLRSLAKAYNYPYEELMKKAGYNDDLELEVTPMGGIDKKIIEGILSMPEEQKKAVLNLIESMMDKRK